jgi:hypothetical protein
MRALMLPSAMAIAKFPDSVGDPRIGLGLELGDDMWLARTGGERQERATTAVREAKCVASLRRARLSNRRAAGEGDLHVIRTPHGGCAPYETPVEIS